MKKTNIVHCYRCNHEYELTSKTIGEVIECGHCHGKMAFTKKTESRMRIVRYTLMFVVCLLLAFVLSMFQSTSAQWILVLVMFLVMLLFAEVADKICIWLTWKIFGLSYVEYHPELVKKKELEEEKEKAKQKRRKQREKEAKKAARKKG